MKRWVIGGILVVLSLLVPQRKYDIGKLLPVEVVLLDKEEDKIIIRTDTDNDGSGSNVQEAVQNLKTTTPGQIFLDTADYLIYTEEAEDAVQTIQSYLHESVRVCKGIDGIDLQQAAEYLSIHEPKTTLKGWKIDGNTELLDKENGKLKILRKNEKRC